MRSFPSLSVALRAVALLVIPAAVHGCGSGPTRLAEVPEECTREATLPPLSVGDAILLSGSAAVLLCPSPPTEDGDYLLVIHQASGDPADSVRLRIRPRSLQGPGAEPSPATGPAPVAVGTRATGASSTAGEEPAVDMGQHLALRERERRDLGWRVRSGPATRDAPARVPAPVPPVGSIIQLNAQSGSACVDPLYRAGEVMAVSSRAIVVADTANPSGGFDLQDYAHFAATFDTLVAPLAEGAFGPPSNFAGHGRTVLFFTQEVNRLSPPGARTVVLGFFFSRDLFPKTETARLQACEHSNERELLYLLAPDPDGRVNGNERSLDYVRRRTVATIAHEYQHLINAGRRLWIVQTSDFLEEVWLNEGLSHVAEELLFFRESGLWPGSNLGIDELRAEGARALTAFDNHQGANANRLRLYMGAPGTNSPYDTGALLPTRGAAWHFLRYALDRTGGEAQHILRPLVDGPEIGVSNLAAALGGEGVLHEWMADWSVALYADSRVPGIAERHRDRSWNHASIFRALDEQANGSGARYPLEPLMLEIEAPFERKIMGGGSDYVRFGIAAGDTASIQLTVGGRFPPGSLRASLMRIR